MLNVHGVLEHDASLSRSDAYFGNNHVFNQSVFDESKKYWTTDILDRYQMSNAKLARQIQSRVRRWPIAHHSLEIPPTNTAFP